MALGSLISGVLPAVASSAANFGLSKLAGGGEVSGQLFTPAPLPSINAGGFRGTGGNIRITPERLALTEGIGEQFLSEADAIRTLGGEGVEGLRALRLKEAEDARIRAIGNLKENLSKRRVLGSSFAQDAVSRAEIEAGRERERIQAQSALASLELKERERGRRRQAIQVQLEDLNLAAEVGLALSGRASSQLSDNARLIAELNAKGEAGRGQFLGELIAPVSRSIGGAFGDASSNFFNRRAIGRGFKNSTITTDAAGNIV